MVKAIGQRAPPLTYSGVVRAIRNNKIEKLSLKAGQVVGAYQDVDGNVGRASVFVNETLLNDAVDHGVDVFISPEEVNPLSLIPMFIFTALAFSIIASMMRRQVGGGPLGALGGENFDIVQETGVVFEDVAGIDEVRGELQEFLDFLKRPEVFKAAGAKTPRGCLLYGPPGTGKTLLAKALAGEANVPFIAVSASQFVELFVGMGASRVRKLFQKAREQDTCIIFIDEIDAIGKQRSSVSSSGGGGIDEREQTLNQMLMEMDGFNTDDNVIVIAATNRIDNLDKALLRPGRFDRKISVSLPDVDGRTKILRVHTKNKTGDWDKLIPGLARQTVGFSGADLENVTNEAAIQAARSKRVEITKEDIEEAYEKVTIGLRRLAWSRSEHMTRIVAYHEAGHALIGVLVGDIPTKVTIVPRGDTGGVTVFRPQEASLYTKAYLFNRVMIAMGGTVAEEVIFGSDNVTTGANGDIKNATQIAKSYVQEYGFSDRVGKVVQEPSPLVDTEVRRIVAQAKAQVEIMLKENRSALDDIAHELATQETIPGEYVLKAVGGRKPPILRIP